MIKYSNILSPSLLAGDHSNLAAALQVVADENLSWVHLDIMDGNFVPNISFGPQAVKDLRKKNSKLFFDTHLMLLRPDKYIEKFIDAGAQLITVHVEPDYPIMETLKKIREKGALAGISLNPDTSVEKVYPFLKDVDLVLVMSVFPGFGGQSFIPEVLAKVEQLNTWRQEEKLNFRIQVDGGVDTKTIPLCLSAGADTLVAGTAFFRAENKKAFIKLIEE